MYVMKVRGLLWRMMRYKGCLVVMEASSLERADWKEASPSSGEGTGDSD
jgi:hypothetical protein